jgi:preprotein translocase subunit SecG/preprotein translocase subunit SecE
VGEAAGVEGLEPGGQVNGCDVDVDVDALEPESERESADWEEEPGELVADDAAMESSSWVASAWGELKQVVWPSRSVTLGLFAGAAVLIVSLGLLTTGLDYVFGHISVRIYGASQAKSTWLIGAFVVVDLLVGLGGVVGILAHRGSDGGLSSLGGLNSSKLATGSSATGRRLDTFTYGCVGVFAVLSAVLAYFLA